MRGLEEIKDLIVPALIARLAAESLDPLLNSTSEICFVTF